MPNLVLCLIISTFVCLRATQATTDSTSSTLTLVKTKVKNVFGNTKKTHPLQARLKSIQETGMQDGYHYLTSHIQELDMDGNNVFHLAANLDPAKSKSNMNKGSTPYKIIETLLKTKDMDDAQKAKLTAALTTYNAEGKNPLHIAAKTHNVGVVKSMLSMALGGVVPHLQLLVDPVVESEKTPLDLAWPIKTAASEEQLAVTSALLCAAFRVLHHQDILEAQSLSKDSIRAHKLEKQIVSILTPQPKKAFRRKPPHAECGAQEDLVHTKLAGKAFWEVCKRENDDFKTFSLPLFQERYPELDGTTIYKCMEHRLQMKKIPENELGAFMLGKNRIWFDRILDGIVKVKNIDLLKMVKPFDQVLPATLMAAAETTPKLMEVLLSKLTNAEAALQDSDGDGKTPMMIAAFGTKNMEMVKVIAKQVIDERTIQAAADSGDIELLKTLLTAAGTPESRRKALESVDWTKVPQDHVQSWISFFISKPEEIAEYDRLLLKKTVDCLKTRITGTTEQHAASQDTLVHDAQTMTGRLSDTIQYRDVQTMTDSIEHRGAQTMTDSIEHLGVQTMTDSIEHRGVQTMTEPSSIQHCDVQRMTEHSRGPTQNDVSSVSGTESGGIARKELLVGVALVAVGMLTTYVVGHALWTLFPKANDHEAGSIHAAPLPSEKNAAAAKFDGAMIHDPPIASVHQDDRITTGSLITMLTLGTIICLAVALCMWFLRKHRINVDRTNYQEAEPESSILQETRDS